MTTYDALTLLAAQIERNVKGSFVTKVVVTPASAEESGLVIKLSLLKTYLQPIPRASSSRMIRVRLTVEGTAESHTGLKQSCEAIEKLDRYFAQPEKRLEDDFGRKIANTRLVVTVNPDDSFIDSPDSIKVQDVQDERMVVITIPDTEE